MRKVLGMALGPDTKVFDIMRQYGINVDYLPSDTSRRMAGNLAVYDKFAQVETEHFSKGKIQEYFRDGVELPEFWDGYFHAGFANKAHENPENLGIEPLNLKDYDSVAISGYDNLYPAIRSSVKYLEDKIDGNIVLGGPIVRKATVPMLRNLSDKVVLNRGSFNNFKRFIDGRCNPKGGVIENNHVLKIDSADMLQKTGLADPRMEHFMEGKKIYFFGKDEKCAGFNVLGLGGCPNVCSYCQSPITISTSSKAWFDVIDGMSKKADVSYLRLVDNNPLENISLYGDIIVNTYKNFHGVFLKNYIDPSTLVSSKDAKWLVGELIKSPKTLRSMFFMGRECVKENVAKNLGRKYKGITRNQERLNKERTEIEQLIGKLESENNIYNLRVSYIVGPGDPGQLEDIQSETRQLTKLGNGVECQTQPLWAFPGTECHEKYKSSLMSQFPGVLISNINDPVIEKFESTMLNI